ncbi:glutathione S-transferase [Alsobacter soli]|uniref:Glutathione S-transferase n=1 Tax=Alsobacter soli TaxID=2109933 RepID=A0A2T1HU09_9HYPH|nr:glutathione S-transferase family protein [Alsobacter soli]PSC05120.1 glutathione S-transferase [Alsobacter soli]
MKLVIANKAYSSWSLRPWILMRALGIPFDEDLIPLDTPEFRPRVDAYGAGRTVPILVDGDVTVWESLAIMDYLADRFPQKAVWPADIKARAFARTIAAEMHAGFRPLRSACPMNLRKRYAAKDRGQDVASDVARILHLWRQARERFGADAGGPFLFGAFTAADAMYAPVVARFQSYSIPVDPDIRAYMDAVLDHPAFSEWQDAGMKEAWIVEHDEVDEPQVGPFRG